MHLTIITFMKRILIISFLILFGFNQSNAQEYVRLMGEKNSNFYEVKESFEEFWDGKEYEKGKGWKQFKRWEYFMETRINSDGIIPNPSLPWLEHKKFQNKYAVRKENGNKSTANWTPIGPTSWNSIGWNPGIGRINAVTIDPNNSNVIYVGTPAGGCWKSSDNGASWIALTDDFSSLGVSGIAIDPNNSNIVYLATGDGDGDDTYSIGVMKSSDGGSSWNSTGLNWSTSQSRTMRRIVNHPTNSNILWVATNNGLWKTIDAGVNWEQVLIGSIRDVEMNAGNPDIIYACTGSVFYMSTAGGSSGSFSSVTNGTPSGTIGRLSIAVTPNDPNYVYLLASDSDDNGFFGLYRSTNGGASFSLRTNTPNVFGYNTDGSDSGGQSWYDMALAVSPSNKNEVYTGGINVWKSTNGGSTLTALSRWNWPTGSYEYVHADIHTIDFYGNTLFVGSDGGIFKSTDNGVNFSDITTGIQNSQFYRLGASATDAGTIMAGAQDNGCSLLKNGTWTHVTGGDGMEVIVDFANPNVMYSTSQNGNIYKSTNGGNSFNGTSGDITENGAWVTPYTLDPNNNNTIFAGYSNVWKSTNAGHTWNTISSFGSNAATIRSLVVAPSNSNIIYAATLSSLKKTIDGGVNWTNITPVLSGATITYITVHDLDPNTFWISLSGFNNGVKVYKTVDGGSNWINVSGNLPNLPVNCVLYENGSNNGIYIGTDIGIYYKNDDLLNWQSFMTDLPNVMVNELEIYYPTGKIRAATYGRGLWESDVFVSAAPTVQFSASDTNICPGNCTQFINETIDLGQQWQWYFPGGTPSSSTDLNPIICYQNIGSYDVSLVASNPNGSDSVFVQDYINVQFAINGAPLPLSEGFESGSVTPTDWSLINFDNGVTWELSDVVGGHGLSSSSVVIDNNSTDFSGEKDYLVTPAYSFVGTSNPGLTFDVAHSPHWAARRDTLAVYYSTDCGVTKNLIYEKDGNALLTATNTPSFFTPDPNEWRNETVNLSAVIGLSSVEFYFENRSGYGNSIYLDNINIIDQPLGITVVNTRNINIYPNPFDNQFSITGFNSDDEIKISVYNSIGVLVFESQLSNTNKGTIKLDDLKSGIYFVKVDSGKEIITKSIVKR
jgi:hypothetical protein